MITRVLTVIYPFCGLAIAVLSFPSTMLAASNSASGAPGLRWICSTKESQWQERHISGESSGAEASGVTPLKLNPEIAFQTIDGFGGCFNELGWEALLALPAEKREQALKELFDVRGANFNLGRAPIGANDFAGGWYSLDETPGDYEMKDFSIERDRHGLIRFIHEAMKYQPKLAVWGVPWCPPSWMTTNGRYCHGHIKDDPRTLQAYALYFAKYLKAYREEGIRVYALYPQNEPVYSDNIYPQCGWTGEQLDRFLRDYLIPHLKRERLDVEIWQGTITSKKLADYTDPVLGDPVTSPGVTGVGYQYAGQDALKETHDKYPTKKLAQTETECYGGVNTWEEGLMTFAHIVQDTNHFAGSYFYWNIALDESQLSRWNWRQNSLLTIDRRKETLVFNPEFFSMKHFSAAVHPGAKRIEVSGGPFPNVVGFQNSDGSKVVVFGNDTDKDLHAALQIGAVVSEFEVPAKSMNTIILP